MANVAVDSVGLKPFFIRGLGREGTTRKRHTLQTQRAHADYNDPKPSILDRH